MTIAIVNWSFALAVEGTSVCKYTPSAEPDKYSIVLTFPSSEKVTLVGELIATAPGAPPDTTKVVKVAPVDPVGPVEPV